MDGRKIAGGSWGSPGMLSAVILATVSDNTMKSVIGVITLCAAAVCPCARDVLGNWNGRER